MIESSKSLISQGVPPFTFELTEIQYRAAKLNIRMPWSQSSNYTENQQRTFISEESVIQTGTEAMTTTLCLNCSLEATTFSNPITLSEKVQVLHPFLVKWFFSHSFG